jgi:hypothetical protein
MTSFALKLPTPGRTAVIEFQGVCWPYHEIDQAREMAQAVGAPGFWRLKALKMVDAEP